MKIDGWKYYNRAAIPTTPPHTAPDMTPITDGRIWQIDGGKPLLVRYTSDYDCADATEFWYVVKDTPLDLSALKAKRRYEINKGLKNFDVLPIDPTLYGEALYEVQQAAFSAYPAKYRPRLDRDAFLTGLGGWTDCTVYGAFSREDGRLAGYSILQNERDGYADFSVQKTDPAYESKGLNAALVAGMLEDKRELLLSGGYICDGARSISHETAFQDYLEKYFGFRKAYCGLELVYRPPVRLCVALLFPFRSLLRRLDSVGAIHRINGVLTMEAIRRGKRIS